MYSQMPHPSFRRCLLVLLFFVNVLITLWSTDLVIDLLSVLDTDQEKIVQFDSAFRTLTDRRRRESSISQPLQFHFSTLPHTLTQFWIFRNAIELEISGFISITVNTTRNTAILLQHLHVCLYSFTIRATKVSLLMIPSAFAVPNSSQSPARF